jgi:hypothetical protein
VHLVRVPSLLYDETVRTHFNFFRAVDFERSSEFTRFFSGRPRGTLIPLLLFTYVNRFDRSQFDVDVRNLELRAFAEEHNHRLEHYSPDFFATFTFRYSISLPVALERLKMALLKVSRRMHMHIFWFGWSDNQHNRGLDGRKYPHFHLFIEGEQLDDLARIAMELHLQAVFDGDVLIERFDASRHAIYYSVSKHPGFAEGISCPRTKNMCNKRGRICGYIWKDGLFANRHR